AISVAVSIAIAIAIAVSIAIAISVAVSIAVFVTRLWRRYQVLPSCSFDEIDHLLPFRRVTFQNVDRVSVTVIDVDRAIPIQPVADAPFEVRDDVAVWPENAGIV